MLYLNEIVEGKIYRKPVKLPRYIDKDAKLTVKNKGCLIYMMTPNFGDALDYLSEERYFKNTNNVFNSYYMDTVYKVKVHNSKVYKNRYAYKSLVAKAKSTYPKIKRVYLKPTDYKGLNLFYDIGLYNSIFRTLAKNLGDDDMSVLNKRNLNECLYDPSISVNTLDETIMTEAYLQTSLVNTNPESYRFQPARLSSLYFDFLKSNVFDKDMSDYKYRNIIVPVDMWLSVD
ncbi:MAG: hypothetical protein ACRCXX_07970, partial [Cetobacterium sp.]|uniref:hypothetical protein n=1 Tax=Cetobacterium sp. TaxID=2071632 RepID=UPI003F36F24C